MVELSTRRRLKQSLATLLESAGVLSLLRRRRAKRGEIAVLAFHRVAGSSAAPLPFGIAPEDFGLLAREASARYRIGSWSDCERAARERDPRPHLAFTFDDGYRDNAENAWPVLRDTGATGIFAVVTGFIDGVEPLWWEVIAAARSASGPMYGRSSSGEVTFAGEVEAQIERLKQLPDRERRRAIEREIGGAAVPGYLLSPPMRWSDVERMASEGAQFAAHGITHASFTRCDDTELAEEIDGCRAALRRHLGRDVDMLAYPNGEWDQRVLAAAKRAGFRWGFCTRHGVFGRGSEPLAIPRIAVTGHRYRGGDGALSWPLLEAEILGVFDLLLRRKSRGLR